MMMMNIVMSGLKLSFFKSCLNFAWPRCILDPAVFDVSLVCRRGGWYVCGACSRWLTRLWCVYEVADTRLWCVFQVADTSVSSRGLTHVCGVYARWLTRLWCVFEVADTSVSSRWLTRLTHVCGVSSRLLTRLWCVFEVASDMEDLDDLPTSPTGSDNASELGFLEAMSDESSPEAPINLKKVEILQPPFSSSEASTNLKQAATPQPPRSSSDVAVNLDALSSNCLEPAASPEAMVDALTSGSDVPQVQMNLLTNLARRHFCNIYQARV